MNRSALLILVATDFSAASDTAIDYARTLARAFGASLHLLHVLEDPSTSGGHAAERSQRNQPGIRSAMLQDARERLARRLAPRDCRTFAETGEVVIGNGAATIVEYAAARGAGLIVMGTHGRTGLAHLLLGSVATRVVRTAECPVLTIRAGLSHPVASTQSAA